MQPCGRNRGDRSLHGSTLTFECLFAFVVVGHGRRQLLWFAVTRHPTAEWLAQQIVEAFPWNTAPTYLVRDNDGAYGQAFTSQVRAMGMRDRPISPRSPWQNPYVERLIGTLRRDCLDHVLILGERAFTKGPVRTRRDDEPSNDLGLSLLHQSCPDCTIATRGYDFWEGLVGACDQRVGSERAALISSQRLAVPLGSPPFGSLQPRETPLIALFRFSRPALTTGGRSQTFPMAAPTQQQYVQGVCIALFGSPSVGSLKLGLAASRGGPGCLNRISASISGASAGVRLPSGGATA